MSTLYIVRGLPGSGKSTLGKKLAGKHCYAADDFFYMIGGGHYAFNPSRLKEAHEYCQEKVRQSMADEIQDIAVANTFSMAWEAEPYFKMAEGFGYTVCVVECQSAFGTIHGVPDEAIQRMASRWEPLTRNENGLQLSKENTEKSGIGAAET